MTPDELTNRFRTAADIPPAVSLDEATRRFLNPKPLPPPRPWYLNPYLMLIPLLTTVVFLLLPGTPDVPILTAFPLTETPAPVAPQISTTATPTTVPARQMYISAGARPVAPLSKSAVEPAAPPPFNVREVPQFEYHKIPAARTPTLPAAQRQAPSPPTALSGIWEFRKKSLHLAFPTGLFHQSYGYRTQLSAAEAEIVRNKNARPNSLRRGAGAIHILEGKRYGQFEFLPDATFRARLNARGWGDAAFDPAELPNEPTFPMLPYPDLRSADRPNDLVWFKYFLAGIDEAYISQLQAFGYTDEELGGLWHLANAQITADQLPELLAFCRQRFTDRPPLARFRSLRPVAWLGSGIDVFGPEKSKYADFRARMDSTGRTLPNLVFDPFIAIPQPLQLPDSITMPVQLNIINPPPGDWGTNTPHVTTDTLSTTKPLLSVKGRIRLLLDDAVPAGKIIVYRPAGATLNQRTRGRKLLLSNDCGGERIDIAVNRAAFRGIRTGRCAVMYH